MTTPSHPPLWQVMTQARYNSEGARLASIRHATAAEIRAIAEWIEMLQVENYAVTLPDVREVIEWLRTEADRAERS